MGLFDRFRRKSAYTTPVVGAAVSSDNPFRVFSAAALDSKEDYVHTYDNRNITFTGDLSEYDYDAILRDKQNNINSLYELSDYYIDKDPIYRGIVKGVYSVFSLTDWKLIGASEKTKQKYEEYYKRINLRDRMASIFYQYFKYANVYVYLMEDGSLITLPVHKIRISNIMMNGEPVLEYNAQSLTTDLFNQGAIARKPYINDEEIKNRLRGFPKEIADAVAKGDQWIQLNPENTFVMQDMKEDWMRYAIPMISSALTPLAKKALIENYENALLNLGIHSFFHVRYGNDKSDNLNLMPNREELNAVRAVFSSAMSGHPLAVTNNYAKAEVIQADTSDLFQFDKYKTVNSEILSAGGISGIIVSGRAEDGSNFASAQVSINTADKRIEHARKNFCELMNKINQRVNGSHVSRSSSDKVPEFTLVPLDLSGNAKFQKTCYELWQQGCVSTETLLQTHGFDFKQELTRKQSELNNGSFKTLSKDALEENDSSVSDSADNTDEVDNEQHKVGRPELPDEERTSDRSSALTGKQPKPSNPDGSGDLLE